MSKLNLLFWGDSPTCATGFGQVSKNLLKLLYETNKYDISVVGINYDGDNSYDTIKYPYKISPATNFLRQEHDVYGRPTLLRKLQSEPVDILFMLQDSFILQTFIDKILEIRDKLPPERKFVIVYYYPIDGTPKKEWIENCVCKVDFPVTYTEYAKAESYKALGKEFPLEVINHGTNKTNFYPMKEEEILDFKQRNFPDHVNDYFVLNVNRNQPRKDMYRSMAAFKLFHDHVPNSFYFLNCQVNDVGGNIQEIGNNLGLELYKDYSFPRSDSFDANQGYPIEIVNAFYNVADLVISSSIGEGWGLSISESMATKTSVLFPHNTSLIEIIGENEERGYFCDSGADVEHFIMLGAQDNCILRPIISIQSMADKMYYVYTHPEENKVKIDNAYQWVKAWKDKSIGGKWLQVFRNAEYKLLEIRKTK